MTLGYIPWSVEGPFAARDPQKKHPKTLFSLPAFAFSFHLFAFSFHLFAFSLTFSQDRNETEIRMVYFGFNICAIVALSKGIFVASAVLYKMRSKLRWYGRLRSNTYLAKRVRHDPIAVSIFRNMY